MIANEHYVIRQERQPESHAHFEMSSRLAEEQNEYLEQVTGNIPSIIAPEEPFNPDPAPEIDPAPPQPEIPTPPPHPNIPPHPNAPAAFISSAELPPHIAPPLA